MASTNKTANLNLNQWVLTDPLLMEDMNADNQKLDAATNDLSSFTDKGSVSSFALTAVKWAVTNAYLSGLGDGTLAPSGKTTRAQFATVLSRFYTGS